MHSRREDAFKEGLGGIQEELMRTRNKSRIVLYYIDIATNMVARGIQSFGQNGRRGQQSD